MTAKSRKATEPFPTGLTPQEEAEWWDAHKDYWDAPDVEWEVVEPQQVRRTQEVKLYLPVDLVEAIKEHAARQDRSYQSLIRAWIDAGLAAEAPRS
jgi:hypothetical protein